MMSFEIGNMRFYKTKYDSLEGRCTVAFTQETKKANPFSLVVTSSGMILKGSLDGEISTEDEIQKLAELISEAWTERRKLKPKLARTLSGH